MLTTNAKLHCLNQTNESDSSQPYEICLAIFPYFSQLYHGVITVTNLQDGVVSGKAEHRATY